MCVCVCVYVHIYVYINIYTYYVSALEKQHWMSSCPCLHGAGGETDKYSEILSEITGVGQCGENRRHHVDPNHGFYKISYLQLT